MIRSFVTGQMLDKSDAILEESLNQRLKKHMTNVSNVTNALTPGYRALGFDFENQLQAAVGNPNDLLMKTTDSRHIKAPGLAMDGVLKPDLYVKDRKSVV